MRKAEFKRKTSETDISLEINLDGSGKTDLDIELQFLSHMLTLLAKHGLFDLKIKARGDIEVDDHHLTEDIAIVLGKAIKEALGEKRGIKRYGSTILPMDEVLCLCALDLCGRFAFATDYEPRREKVSDFSTEMLPHFFKTLAVNAEMALHIRFLDAGENEHHRIEAAFKAFARALLEAITIDPKAQDSLPSTKGIL